MLKKATLTSVYSGLQCCVCVHPQATAPGTSTTSPSSILPFRTTSTIPQPLTRSTANTQCRGYRSHKRPRLEGEKILGHQIPKVADSPRPRQNQSAIQQRRSYATIRPSKRTYDFRDNLNWPCCHNVPNRDPSTFPVPTPYEIFELEKGGTYEKHKFYELVKMYHPDRNLNSDGSQNTQQNKPEPEGMFKGVKLTHLQKLERYRLVVQAHQILSDPVKRSAYDAYGTGWGTRTGGPSSRADRYSRGYSSDTAGAEGRNYGTGPEDDSSPFANATWEDWERWYRRNNDPNMRQAYAGTYFNPNAFASFVILLAVISGIVQATRAGQYSSRLEEKANNFTEKTSRFLAERADSFNEGDQKMTADGRIKHFLQKRDPSRYGLKDEEEEAYRRYFASDQTLTPPPGMGSSRNNTGEELSSVPSHSARQGSRNELDPGRMSTPRRAKSRDEG